MSLIECLKFAVSRQSSELHRDSEFRRAREERRPWRVVNLGKPPLLSGPRQRRSLMVVGCLSSWVARRCPWRGCCRTECQPPSGLLDWVGCRAAALVLAE